MGAYLSTPVIEKISTDKATERIKYGASSMQGWRVAQEDSHNCFDEFEKDSDTSLFAVYDGHGGAEVAQYASSHFPEYLKHLESYRTSKLAQALEEAFLGFDELLTKEEVIKELKELAGVNSDDNQGPESGEDEAKLLYEEATMPLEKLLEKYGGPTGKVRQLRKDGQFCSPVIKPKTEGDSSTDQTETNQEPCSVNDSIRKNIDNELINGVSENENNENKEKEKAKTISADSTPEESVASGSDIAASSSSSTDPGSASIPRSPSRDNLPDSSTDVGPPSSPTVSPVRKIPEDNDCGEAVSATSEASSSCGQASSTAQGPSSTSEEAGGSSTQCPEPGSSSGAASKDDDDDDDESSMSDDTEDDDSSDEALENIVEPDSEDDEDEEDEEMMEDNEEEGEMDGFMGQEEPGSDSGTTAVVALLKGNDLHVANAGDSRCVLCRAGKAVDMSVDHKPEDDIEQDRISRAGGRVTPAGRVNGGLNLSRALGDHCYKRNVDLPLREQMITPLPDVKSLTLGEEDEFMVLACDGIWNVMTSQDVVQFVKERIDAGVDKLSTICEEMFDFCLAPDTTGDGTGCDNMTCIIVRFNFLHKNHQFGNSTKRKQTEEPESTESEAKKLKPDT